MSFSDETIAAYVDGEMDPAASAEIEEAARGDPSLERRIASLRSLRERLQAAYAPELDEPVPDRLLAALRGAETRSAAAAVADVGAARAAARAAGARRSGVYWRYSLAASVLIAVGAGIFVRRQAHTGVIENVGGTLIARGPLAEGLSNDLAGGESRSRARIGLSFLAKSGDYCRTFSLREDAGLACRRGGRWEILALVKERLAPGAAGESGSQFRTASSSMPEPIREVVEAQISGEPLDRAAEIAAREGHWSPAKRE